MRRLYPPTLGLPSPVDDDGRTGYDRAMHTPRNPVAVAAATFGFTAVALGAFGAHALRPLLSPQAMDWWRTGVEYHLVHSVVLLALAFVPAKFRARTFAVAAFLFGILLFSGSLYLLALTDARWLGAVTPLGGASLLAGWVALGVLGWSYGTTRPEQD